MCTTRLLLLLLLLYPMYLGGGSAQPHLEADPPGHVTCDACWEAIPHPVDWMTDACENITLRQTSFADGKNKLLIF